MYSSHSITSRAIGWTTETTGAAGAILTACFPHPVIIRSIESTAIAVTRAFRGKFRRIGDIEFISFFIFGFALVILSSREVSPGALFWALAMRMEWAPKPTAAALLAVINLL